METQAWAFMMPVSWPSLMEISQDTRLYSAHLRSLQTLGVQLQDYYNTPIGNRESSVHESWAGLNLPPILYKVSSLDKYFEVFSLFFTSPVLQSCIPGLWSWREQIGRCYQGLPFHSFLLYLPENFSLNHMLFPCSNSYTIPTLSLMSFVKCSRHA